MNLFKRLYYNWTERGNTWSINRSIHSQKNSLSINNLSALVLLLFFSNGAEMPKELPGVIAQNVALPFENITENDFLKDSNISKRVFLSSGNKKISFDVFFVDLDESEIQFFHKEADGKKIKNIANLKKYLTKKSEKLLFATNGGMYNKQLEPEGLYIEKGKIQYALNQKKGIEGKFTNFYDLPPNGVFYLTNDNQYGIVPREQFAKIKNVKYATQSAPMVSINGAINNIFKKSSTSKHIRSGVGVAKKNGIMNKYELIFAISNQRITFYDFTRIFKYYACKDALYLDGAISEMYLDNRYLRGKNEPVKRPATKNNFASIIAITEKK